MQKSLKSLKRLNKGLQENVETLSAALDDSRNTIRERNAEIRKLRSSLRGHEVTIDLLQDELAQVHELSNNELVKHNDEIEDLVTQLKELQERSSNTPTFTSRAYTTNVRALYYSLLSMCLPPAQIKSIVINVIS